MKARLLVLLNAVSRAGGKMFTSCKVKDKLDSFSCAFVTSQDVRLSTCLGLSSQEAWYYSICGAFRSYCMQQDLDVGAPPTGLELFPA